MGNTCNKAVAIQNLRQDTGGASPVAEWRRMGPSQLGKASRWARQGERTHQRTEGGHLQRARSPAQPHRQCKGAAPAPRRPRGASRWRTTASRGSSRRWQGRAWGAPGGPSGPAQRRGSCSARPGAPLASRCRTRCPPRRCFATPPPGTPTCAQCTASHAQSTQGSHKDSRAYASHVRDPLRALRVRHSAGVSTCSALREGSISSLSCPRLAASSDSQLVPAPKREQLLRMLHIAVAIVTRGKVLRISVL